MTVSRFNLRAYVKKYNKIYRVCELHTDNEYLTVQICDNDNTVVFDKDKKINPTLFSKNEIELMQSTGMVDKNGKEIFEGDFLKDDKTGDILNVQWREDRACFGVSINENWQDYDWRDFGELDMYDLESLEIIGNEYENPELLRSKK
jgi:uncharacterized phage protein (TIGR01671 family)